MEEEGGASWSVSLCCWKMPLGAMRYVAVVPVHRPTTLHPTTLSLPPFPHPQPPPPLNTHSPTHPPTHPKPTPPRVYWALGGELRTEREYAHAQFLDGAAEEGPSQPASFTWLGHWYREVAGDEGRARRCYQRALALDPGQVRGGGGEVEEVWRGGGGQGSVEWGGKRGERPVEGDG
jgi:hypothetical protein